MTGRWHNGDENGQTQYQYATLKAVNVRGESVPGNITVEDIIWHPAVKESDGMGFSSRPNHIYYIQDVVAIYLMAYITLWDWFV